METAAGDNGLMTVEALTNSVNNNGYVIGVCDAHYTTPKTSIAVRR